MWSCTFLLFASLGKIFAITVSGAAEGFARGVRGGGSASPVYPKTNDELVSYLKDNSPRVIVLTKTFDFTGTQGRDKGTGCAPWGRGAACQVALNANNWCKTHHPGAPTVSVSYDKAGILGITITSNKTLLGKGSSGAIKGRGIRVVHGASNVIVQNIAITDINPKVCWGGDGITLDGTDMVWIDHVTTARIGRQHIVLGKRGSGRVTISNSYIDGRTKYSAKCNSYHYWNLFFTGSSDLVTLKGNYIFHTSGRAPKVGGNTLLHAVNNYWYDNDHHGFEIDAGGMALVEGNYFQKVNRIFESPIRGQLFSSPDTTANAACKQYLGRSCVMNGYGGSSVISKADKAFLRNFRGKNIASASAYTSVANNVRRNAGQGKLRRRWLPW
ncbi:polysaccharide lyase family 1 protein [Myriangium duriaei CBS 260.36]|uniref:pectin lyase n=1 Tax=Myriangium duriaei CBS 260.36 TaxID=1168546 RepID=A0A9P4MCU9_9PEZI|nr:polysaccharide lyase family 1 protein [Myriangium duriaei CBS 260.36]